MKSEGVPSVESPLFYHTLSSQSSSINIAWMINNYTNVVIIVAVTPLLVTWGDSWIIDWTIDGKYLYIIPRVGGSWCRSPEQAQPARVMRHHEPHTRGIIYLSHDCHFISLNGGINTCITCEMNVDNSVALAGGGAGGDLTLYVRQRSKKTYRCLFITRVRSGVFITRLGTARIDTGYHRQIIKSCDKVAYHHRTYVICSSM